jgi:hypothetical protein
MSERMQQLEKNKYSFKNLYPSMSYEFERIMLEQNRYIFRGILIKQPSGIEVYI